MEKLEHTSMSDNEIIAEFMDLNRIVHNPEYFITDHGMTHQNEFRYNSSWDWLMPVVEKIAQHVYEIWQDSNGYKEVTHHDRAYPRTFGMIDSEGKWMVRINRMPLEQESTLIEATYKAVVEFIKWHNAEKLKHKQP